jgi:hypothetical protein
VPLGIEHIRRGVIFGKRTRMKKVMAICLFVLPLISPAQNFTKMSLCLVDKGQLSNIIIDYDPSTGDKSVLVGGVRKKLADVYPSEGKDYAAGTKWFMNNEPVSFNNRSYVKYGLPRILGNTEIEKKGIYNGVGVYVEAGRAGSPEVIYLPVRQGCEFQPYQVNCTNVYIEKTAVATSTTQDYLVKIEGETEKISYNWEGQDVKLIKGQGTNRVSIDIKDKQEGDEYGLTIFAATSKKCWMGSDWYSVKPLSKPTTAKWGTTERNVFMKDCIPATKMEVKKGTAYCSCVLEKIMRLFPDPIAAQKGLTQEKMMPLAKECLTGL